MGEVGSFFQSNFVVIPPRNHLLLDLLVTMQKFLRNWLVKVLEAVASNRVYKGENMQHQVIEFCLYLVKISCGG